MNNQKFIKTLNIILLILVIIFAGFIIFNKIQDNKLVKFQNECQEFSEIISNKMGNNDDYLIEVSEYNGNNHDTLHLILNIFNYDETKLTDYEFQLYAVVEDEFKKYDFTNERYNKIHIDIFNSEKNGTEILGHGVSYKEISK